MSYVHKRLDADHILFAYRDLDSENFSSCVIRLPEYVGAGRRLFELDPSDDLEAIKQQALYELQKYLKK